MESSNTSFSLSKRSKIVDPKQLLESELTSPHVKLGNLSPLKPITVSASSNSGGVPLKSESCSSLSSGDSSSASRCPSNNQSRDIVKASLRFVDLKAKSFEAEISTRININISSKETTPSIELIGVSEETESRDRKTSPSPSKQPSQAEIDEFFSVAENKETTPALIELIGDSEETESQDKKTSPSPSPSKHPSQVEIDEFFSVAEKYEQVRFAEKYNYDIVKDVPLDGRYQWIRINP